MIGPRHRRQGSRRAMRPAFTLIELLVVIAIIALLLAILLPSLAKAREQAKAAVCLSSLQDVGKSTQMYIGNDEQPVLRWYTTPPYTNWGTVQIISPFVFGGFKAPDRRPDEQGRMADNKWYPANTFNGAPDTANPGRTIDVRAINKYVAAESRDDDIVDIWVCPGDTSHRTSIIGSSTPNTPTEEEASSWQMNGTSYGLNSRFIQGYAGIGQSWSNIPQYFTRIAPWMVGGTAGEFILWVEQGFYSQTYNAGPDLTLSQARPQSIGWHKEFSKWCVGFADGHGEYRYFDTRLSRGTGWTIWQPRFVYQP